MSKKYEPWDIVEVPLAEDMDDETFLRHIETRHAKEAKVEKYLHRHAIPAWIGVYRAFHERLHQIATPGQYDHDHEYWDDEEDEGEE